MRTRIPKKRAKPRRKRPELFGHNHGERLYGKAKTRRRRELFERSKGHCEAIVYCKLPECQPAIAYHNWRCYAPITWETMEWSHKRHAANKCDCMQCGIASCKECHHKRHNPKAVPPKPKLSTTG